MRWPISVSFDPPPYLQRLFARLIRPVVVTNVRLRNRVDSEEGESDSLIAVLEFNDAETNADDPDYVDLNQLRSSFDNNGIYYIWTCSCGAPGCAGLNNGVHVTHSNGTTTWHDLDLNRRFVLNAQRLRDAFDRAIIEGRDLLVEGQQKGQTGIKTSDRRYLCAALFSDDGAPLQGSSRQSTPKRFP